MIQKTHILEPAPTRRPHPALAFYRATPLYVRILVALAIGVGLGIALGENAEPLKWVSRIVLRILGALAPALILVAVMDSILSANVKGRGVAKMAFLLVLNTLVAILIGLAVANIVQPGRRGEVAQSPQEAVPTAKDLGGQLLENIPQSVLEPLVTNNVIGIVFLAAAFGIAFRRLAATHDISIVNQFISLSFKAIVVILHWVLDLVPLAVLCTVAQTVGACWGYVGLHFFSVRHDVRRFNVV